jgi:hypothetical protein
VDPHHRRDRRRLRQQSAEKGDDPFTSANSAAPEPRELRIVHIQLYETAEATTPTLDMDMNNAASTTSRSASTRRRTPTRPASTSPPTGEGHRAGQVRLRRRGLTIRWNDLDRRLELLEVAHGDG